MSGDTLHDLNRRALDPAASVVVSACAGSGKTWLLVSRIVRLLLAGAVPSEILAITFTRKAAQEMASRLRDWLRELATAPDDDAVRSFLREREMTPAEIEAALPRARLAYETFLTAQPAITITTFHSWFLQLLRRAPLDAGALGAVDLVEQTSSLVDDAWQRFASSAQREPDGPVAQGLDYLFRELGLDSTRRLMGAFLARRAEWWAYTRRQKDPVAFALGRIIEDMRPLAPESDVIGAVLDDGVFAADVREYAVLLERNADKPDQENARLGRALVAAEALAVPERFRAFCAALLTQAGALRKHRASKAAERRLGSTGQARFLSLHAALGERLQNTLADLAEQASYCLNEAAMHCGAALLETYQAVKRERQVIDYADIEWHAYDLVTAAENAAYMHCKLDARYRHILLDEFQDTNPLQWLTLKSWFTAAGEADTRPSVFMVGDPKQSIYRFRRAEARLFEQARDYLVGEFGAVVLSQDESRRCAPPVIEIVNRVFEQRFDGFVRHGAHYSGKPGWVEVLPLAQADEPGQAEGAVPALRDPLATPLMLDEDRRREREAAVFVARLQEIVATCQVAEDMHGTDLRPARYDDVMVLVRRRTHLEVYERALRRAGIPFVTSRQGGLLATLEAQDLIALLEFLVAPFSDLQLAHALRSPIFGCSDEDLVALARAGENTWWERLCTVACGAQSSATLERAHGLLARWLARTDTAPVHDQLDRIYFEGDVLARYQQAAPEAMRAGVVANLQAFMQRALDADSGRYPSLPRFIRELVDLRDAPLEEAPDEGIVGEAGRALRIYTVHGAKGLEAPIVWLLDAAAGQDRARPYDALCDWPPERERPLHFSLRGRKDMLGARQRELGEQEAALGAREDLNLLYVAMTRAKQGLIVSGIDGRGAPDSWYEKICAAVDVANGGVPRPADAVTHFGTPPVLEKEELKKFEAPPSARPGQDARLNAPLPAGARVPAVTTRGMRYGTHFHLVMERLTGPVPADREATRRALGLAPEDFDPLWDDAQRLLANPAFGRFFAGDKFLRAANEISFVNAAGAVRRIDRLVETERDVWVLDYKTGHIADDAELLRQYEAQVGEYRAALAGLYPGKAVRALLIFSGGEVHEIGGS